MSETVKMVAMMTAAPGRRAELQAIMQVFVEATRQEPGCLEFTLHQSMDDEEVLILTELWIDQAAIDAHLAGSAVEKVREAGRSGVVVANQLHHLRALS